MQQVFNQRDQIFRRYQIHKFRAEGIVPAVTMTVQVNVTSILELRKKANTYISDTQHITITHIITKAVANTLKNYPLLFDFFNGKEIIENKELVICIPVDIENHLEYITLHSPDSKGLSTIAREFTSELSRIHSGNGTFLKAIKQLMEESNNSGFNPIEFLRKHHGNFVISNFGSFHIDNGSIAIAQPIISGLCVGSVKQSAYKKCDQWVEIMTMPLTITFDHRPIDGAYAGRFLNDVRSLLQNPEKLFEDI